MGDSRTRAWIRESSAAARTAIAAPIERPHSTGRSGRAWPGWAARVSSQTRTSPASRPPNEAKVPLLRPYPRRSRAATFHPPWRSAATRSTCAAPEASAKPCSRSVVRPVSPLATGCHVPASFTPSAVRAEIGRGRSIGSPAVWHARSNRSSVANRGRGGTTRAQAPYSTIASSARR